MKLYKVRRFVNGGNSKGEKFYNYSITIPSEIARQLDENMRFSCELTKEGILFRPTTVQDAEPKLPDWANVNGKVPA